MSNYKVFPYAAIVGQNDFKLALELSLIDRSIGGVLVSGDKGTGKTTTVRSLSALMHEGSGFPFINLPVGASEDRVLGTVDLEKLINEKKQVLQKGLLAQANGGILYIDEVNLLPDYLTDMLLDAAATGGYHLERDGLSAWQESRFSLVGTMNPEEGALRPQLLDRFGFGVDVKTTHVVEERVHVAQRRMAFDDDPVGFAAAYAEQQSAIRKRLLQATASLPGIQLPDAIFVYASALCLRFSVEGLRADVLLVKAARAYAALQNRDVVTTEDVDAVAPFVLRYRTKTPPPPSGNTPQGSGTTENNGQGQQQQNSVTQPAQQLQQLQAERTTQSLKVFRKHNSKAIDKGKAVIVKETVVSRPVGRPSPQRIDILKSVARYTWSGNFRVIYKPTQGQGTVWMIFLVDSSASMVRDRQIQHCKGIIERTLQQYAGKRISFAGIGLLNGTAEIFHAGTTDAEAFAQSLATFHSGGRTNLTAGFQQVSGLLKQQHRARHEQKQLYILTDGRINAGATHADPLDEAVDYYHKYLKNINYTHVLNTESGFVKLGHARTLADKLRVTYSAIA